MNPTPPDGEDELASVLAACDDALAKGESVTDEAGLSAEQSRLLKNLEFVRMLRRAWPKDHPTLPSDTGPTPATPRERLGRFTIARELGRGGFGIVYLAFDPRLARTVALKVPRSDVLSTPQSRQRFQQEARAAAALDHPNIVAVYEADEVDGVAYIAAAYCPGVTLAKWLDARHDGVPFDQAVSIITQLADGVQHAHERGVLHRDLKPANVLIAPISPISPKITDFGLARTLGEEDPQLTATGAVLGTPNYIAPEQTAGKSIPVGPAVDIYGLGAILYELLTRRPPFTSDSALETLRQVRSEDPIAPRRLRAQVPRDLETICLKCLEKEPARRYKSAADLVADLRRFAAGEPIRARPIGVAARAIKWAKRRPTLTVALAASVLALIGIAIGALWYQHERSTRRSAVESDVNAAIQETIALYGRAEGAERDLGRWSDALAAAKKAQALAATADAAPELRERTAALAAEVERHARRHRLIALLADIQASMGDDLLPNNDQDFPGANSRYEQAFAECGVNLFDPTPEAVADALRGLGGSPIALAEALDNWTYVRAMARRGNATSKHLSAVARLLDPDPLRNRIREAIVVTDRKGLRALAAKLDPATQPVQTVNLVGAVLICWVNDKDFEPELEFLQRAQFSHGRDFQINHNLAYALNRVQRHEEALIYAVAAVALRDTSAAAWQDRAIALKEIGRDDEALAAHRRVAALAPRAVWHLQRIGAILEVQGRTAEAAEAYRQALKIVPTFHPTYGGFTRSWKRLGMIDDAIAEYRNAISRKPDDVDTRLGLISILKSENRWKDMVDAYDGLIGSAPPTARHFIERGDARGYLAQEGKRDWIDVHSDFVSAVELGNAEDYVLYQLAVLSLRVGDEERFKKTCRDAVARFGKTKDKRWANNLAGMCLLAPSSSVDPATPVRLAEQAVSIDPSSRIYRNTLGFALFRAGEYERAHKEIEVSLTMRTLDIDGFDWLILAMAHQRQGHAEDARKHFEKAARWRDSKLLATSEPRPYWTTQLEFELLHHEAGKMFEKR